LIELLVVIAILAVLSTIGFAVFQGVQPGARDAKRKADIDAIAKAMEVHFGECAVGKYCNLKDTHFSGGVVPIDPLYISSSVNKKCGQSNNHVCDYCISGTNVMPASDPNFAHDGCGDNTPNRNQSYLTDQSYWVWPAYNGNPGTTTGAGGVIYQTSFVVCANLEAVSNGKWYYCISNQQ